jgi:soluble lytic murein transglycosylase-like protein
VPEVANLQVVVSADTTQLDRGLADANKSVTGLGSSITSALGGAAVGAVVGLGAAFVGSVKSAADFEKQMSAIGAVSGATQTEMDALTQTALQLGKDTSFSAKEAAQGMEELVKAGVSVNDVIGGAGRAALDLAAAGAVSVADAAEIASNALNVFNLSGADMAHVADQIAGAANASAIGVNDYKFSLAAAGAVAATVGIGFEDLTTAIAAMGNAGIKGSDAGTSLKTMMMNLIPSTNKQKDLFRELGIITFDVQRGLEGAAKKGIVPATQDLAGLSAAMMDHLGLSRDTATWTKKQQDQYEELSTALGLSSNQFFDASGKAKSFADIAQVLQNALSGMTEEQKLATLETMFGSDAIRAAAVIAKEGAAGFNELAASIGKVTAQQVAEERLNNLWGSVEKLKGSLETAAIMLGSIFLPALKTMVDSLTTYVNQGIEILEQLPDAWRTIQQVMAGAWEPSETIQPFTNAVGLLAVAFRDQLWPTIQVVAVFVTDTLMPAFQSLAGFLVAHPEIIAGIVAAWGAFVVITTVIGWITGAIAAFGALSGAITAAGGVIAAIIAVLGGPLTLAVLAIVAVIGLLTAAWVGNWFDIQGKTAAAVAAITPLIQGMLTTIEGFWTAHGAAIMTIVDAVWTIISTGAQNAFIALTAIFTAGMQLLAGDWQAAWTTITTAAQAIWDGWGVQLQAIWTIISTLFATEIATIQGIWQAGWDALNAILTAAWNLLSTENQTRITELITLMTELWTTLKELWTTGTTALSELMTTWWAERISEQQTQQAVVLAETEAMWTSIQGAWQTALDTLRAWWTEFWGSDLGQTLSGAVTALTEAATALGTAIMDALIAAVNAGAKAMLTAVTGAVQQALDAARSLIGGAKGVGGGAAVTESASTQERIARAKQLAVEQGLDPELFAAQLMQESGFQTGAVSSAGARGIGQFMPSTGATYAARLGVSYDEMVNSAELSMQAAAMHMADLTASLGSQERALSGYFAGPGGGVHPEYVSAVRGRLPQVAGVPVPPSGVVSAQRTAVPQIGQFGLTGGSLTAYEAAAFCGPAAAMWFAQIYGRMPNTAEAEEMARAVGWTPQYGMAGPASQQRLLSAMGVPTTMQAGTPAEIAALAAQNVPFQISTAGGGPGQVGHYYQVQGGTLAGLNVGASGTALAGGAATMSLDQIIALSGAINGVITLAPQMGAALATASATGGTALQGLLVAAHTLADGSTVAITDMNGQITASIISATGQVTATYGQMATAVTEQSATMATGVTANTNLMATGALTSVTNLGGAIMTTVQATSAGTITTIADMSGQVTSQYATLANGVTLTMGDMAAGVLTSTTDLGGAIMTTVQDMSGNYITTITDMSGNVTAQYVSLAEGATAATAEMSAGVTEETAAMAETVLTSVTDLGDAVLTITQDTAGNYVATITDMAGNVTSQYTTMSDDVVGTTEEMANTVVETFGEASSGIQDAVSEWGEAVTDGLGDVASDAASAAEEIGQSISEGIAAGIEDSAGDVADAVRDVVEEAIEEAKDEAEAESPSKLFARELGVPIALGVAEGIRRASGDVYDASRELIAVPPAPGGGYGGGYGGGGGRGGGGGTETIILKIDIGGRVAEEIVVEGRQLAIRRGRIPAGAF